jgi:lactate dehydrogenase-like 2-hydroxyacid dehydrogenase
MSNLSALGIVTCPNLNQNVVQPAYMTRSRFEKAKKLEVAITAGIGSDHIDLHAAADKGITVSEVTGE